MKKAFVISVSTAALLTHPLFADTDTEKIEAMSQQIEQLQEELEALKASSEKVEELEERSDTIEEDIMDLNSRTSGNALKFGVDFRTAVDNLHYEMADGEEMNNDAFITNRLWLNMDWKATENLSFTGQLAYNKAYGNRSGFGDEYAGFETFDWITNENAYDDTLRVRSAYFFYQNDTFLSAEIPWTFSIGRRPSTNGNLINLRDDDKAASPIGHSINVEFDGLSSKFSFDELTGIDGLYIKFCAGRGGSNASAKFFTVDMNDGTPNELPSYVTNNEDLPNIDLVGAIFVPYNDGQYKIATQYYYAANLIDADMRMVNTADPSQGMYFAGMTDVGNMHSLTAFLKIDGIGDEWSDFLDDTTVFVSGAWSKTEPKDGEEDQGMLGSKESEIGHSVWAGVQFPSLISDYGRWGFEYNRGSEYWRSITYGEDTNIGSKVAARGQAYEAYITEPIHEEVLSLQIRYTYIDYDYTGSNGFFGSTTGTPMKIEDLEGTPYAAVTVDKAQDIRAYIRYRF